ncbi:hypothetical protein N8697_01570, partial [bacterium]|nr:hypothetical protein [bacterium]
LLSVPIGLILGLGMTRIMTGAITTVRNREHVRVHWLPLVWAASFMIQLLIFFCVLWDLKVNFENAGIEWTWSYYGPQVLHTIFMFLGAGLLLPVSRESNTDCLLKDFNKHGKLALIPLMAMHFLAWPMNMHMSNVPLFDKANYLNFVMIAVIAVGFKASRLNWQAAAAIIYLSILIYASLSVWSRPGHIEDIFMHKPSPASQLEKSSYHPPVEPRRALPKALCGSGLGPQGFRLNQPTPPLERRRVVVWGQQLKRLFFLAA